MPQYRVGGAFFHASTVHAIPQRETDADRCTFNRRSAKPARRSPANRESPSLSHSSSKRLPSQRFRQRQPRSSGVLLHPRHFNGPTLRMAIAKCRQPGSTHHLNELTGKSGRYVYDSCAGRANTATTISALIRNPVATLDDIVLDAVEEQVLERQRFKCLLTEFLGLTTAEIERGKRGLTLLRSERTRTEKAIASFLSLAGSGLDGSGHRLFFPSGWQGISVAWPARKPTSRTMNARLKATRGKSPPRSSNKQPA